LLRSTNNQSIDEAKFNEAKSLYTKLIDELQNQFPNNSVIFTDEIKKKVQQTNNIIIEYKYSKMDNEDEQFEIIKNVTIINISQFIKEFGDSCFSQCYKLTIINLPSPLKSLGDYCFSRCLNLTTVHLPSSLQSISHYCFLECLSLTTINFPS
jgi:hypothetical protein